MLLYYMHNIVIYKKKERCGLNKPLPLESFNAPRKRAFYSPIIRCHKNLRHLMLWREVGSGCFMEVQICKKG